MKVAVVVPVRNGGAMLADCITACRAQTRAPDQLIIVDNASTDDTFEQASSLGAQVLRESRRGPAAARNSGWRFSDADVVAFTDVDCHPEPGWLESLVAPFADPTVGAVGGPIVQLGRRSRSQRWIAQSGLINQESNWRHPFLPYFATANAGYRRSLLEAVDGFDHQLITGEDNDIGWRAQVMARASLVYRPDAVVHHAVGPRIQEVVSRGMRYGAGDILLEQRWANWPGYPDPGTVRERTKPAWMLPLAITRDLTSGRLSFSPVMDALFAVSWEIGRLEGHWKYRRVRLAPISTKQVDIGSDGGDLTVND